jgi:hypothetical protein
VSKDHSNRAELQRARSELAARLRERFGEIEESVFSKVRSVSGPLAGQPPDYVEGLRSTVVEGLEYGIGAIEHGQNWSAPVPIAAIAQAKRAARVGVSLSTILRRYTAGDRELAVYVREEAHGLPPDLRQEIERTQGVPVDRLMEAVASEYWQEVERMKRSPTSGLEERIRRLLDGDVTVDLDPYYELGSWHVGIIADEATAENAIHRLAKQFDARLLFTHHISTNPCAWLARRGGLDVDEIERFLTNQGATASFALGEARSGIEGWRLTHFEARVTFDATRHVRASIARARDVVLPAAVMRDPLLTEALLSSYVKPLDEDGEEVGADLRQTLRAYFSTGHHASAAAELLGVNRRTVANRLRAIESRLGQRIEDCHAEVHVALRLEALLRPKGPVKAPGADAAESMPADT